MIRKLAFALSLLGASFTGFVHALGLGEAEVKSSLNQPLKAEIELVNVKGLTKEEILPGLATREEFLKAGVDRVYFLSDMNFTVETNQSGEPIVVLTTNKPVREPFLNFLAEVIWPSGRLLREYALLIDPPTFTEEKAQPVQAPATQTAQQVSGDVVAVPSRQSVSTPQASRIQAAGEYGPTDSKDTLWDIALKARPDRSVSPQQVMLAIQDLNPKAFIDSNINKLKAGQVLRLPTLDQIRQRTSYQAVNEVIAQNEALRPAKRKAVVSVSKVKVPQQTAPSRAAGDELKLVVADKAAAPIDSASSGDAETGGASKATSEELALTLEKLDKANSDNAELTGRMGDLEEQLETLQRLLTLKNDQLASLQEQMQANELARLQADSQKITQPEADQVEGDVKDGAPMADAKPAIDEEAGEEQKAQEEAPKAEAPKVAEQKEAEKPQVKKKPESVTEPVPPQSFMETIFSNPLYMGLGALAILVLIVLLWFVSRSNAQREQAFQESYTEGDEQDSSEPEGDEETGEELEEQEGSFDQLAEQSEDIIPQDEEEDAIAEADVYIAYGRLDQAAGILEEAISSDPVRTDYRLKLLEVYKESNDVEAFNRQFSELEAIQDADAIEQASQIRSEMLDSDVVSLEDMEQDLLSGDSESTSVDEEEAAIETESEALDQEEELAEEDSSNKFDFDSVEEVDSSEEPSEDEELDIDLSSEELDVDLDIDLDVDKQKEQDDYGTIEYEEPELDLDEEVSEELEDAELDVALDDVELTGELEQESEIDLPADLDLSEELSSDILESGDESIEADFDLDESEISESDLGGLDEAPVAAEESAEVEEESEAEETVEIASEEDHVVSDDILEEAVEALGDPDDFESDLGDAEDFDFLEGTDEASTKLDLARAYIDMGDIEGARDILEEVKSEGSDEQQSEAQGLLDSIDD